jgi:beta-lactamase class A
MLDRRSFIYITAFALPRLLYASPTKFSLLPRALAELEQANGGRIGVAVLETGTGESSGYRAEERFPMCSTFKFLLAAAVLQRVDRGDERLEQSIAIPQHPLLPHSPSTEAHAGRTMTIAALCEAILTQSDNTAANLLLERTGGPESVTTFAHSIGDPVTRLNRVEPFLNESRAGDPRDTTSPAAMAGDLKSVVLGNVLSLASRNCLVSWMERNTTGVDRLRAKLPSGWRAADKTGSNGEHTSNDIAVLWAPSETAPCRLRVHYAMQGTGRQEGNDSCRNWATGYRDTHVARHVLYSAKQP